MSEWKKCKLGDICSRLSSGKGISSSEIKETGKYPVYGGNGLRGYTDKSNFCGECAIIGRQGAFCGNVRFFSGEAYMTEHAVIVCANESHNTRYLSYLLSTMGLGRLSGQSAQPGLSVKTLSLQTIILPSLSEQKIIADTLSALDDKIENNNKINHHLEQMAQAIFKSWFVDFEPFGGVMPPDWKIKKLGEVCQCVLGGTPNRNKSEYWGGNIPWINSGEINRFRITSPSEYITENGLRHSATKMLPAKTVVLAITGATLGQISILEINSCANQSVVGVVPCEALPYEFIYPFIQKEIQNIISNKTGGAQQHINKQNIENVLIMLPTNQNIKNYHNIVSPIYATISNNCFESARLAELRDTLLPRLMSGELSVFNLTTYKK